MNITSSCASILCICKGNLGKWTDVVCGRTDELRDCARTKENVGSRAVTRVFGAAVRSICAAAESEGGKEGKKERGKDNTRETQWEEKNPKIRRNNKL